MCLKVFQIQGEFLLINLPLTGINHKGLYIRNIYLYIIGMNCKYVI